jgi:hypothetical protein
MRSEDGRSCLAVGGKCYLGVELSKLNMAMRLSPATQRSNFSEEFQGRRI